MAKILVLYYSSYGHIETMARAVAEGARSVAGAEVTVKRVPELVPEEIARKSGMKIDQEAPVASPNELGDYDAIIFGTPTRYGNMAAQMRNFLDQTGGLSIAAIKLLPPLVLGWFGAMPGWAAFASTPTPPPGLSTPPRRRPTPT